MKIFYKRYTIENVKLEFKNFNKCLELATDASDLIKARMALQQIMDAFSTAHSVCYYNYCLNTSNEFYKNELAYYDENCTTFFDMKQQVVKLICSHKYGSQVLEHMHPEIARAYSSTFDIDYSIIEDELNQESTLIKSYIELMSSLQYTLDGKVVSFQELQRILRISADECTRRKAATSIGQTIESQKEAVEDIFSKLVNVRNIMAIKTGFANFVDFSYARLGRIDYTSKNICSFKFNVLKYITPLLKKLKTNNIQQSMIKYYNDDWYDIPYSDQITIHNVISIAEIILEQISSEIADNFREMSKSGLIDFEKRANKVNYNFCTAFQSQKESAILLNLTGSLKDIDTIMHEFGHALANAYMMAREDSEIGLGGRETMEAHALTMELFGSYILDELFEDENCSFKKMHIINALNTLAYSAVVDDFQEKIYTHPYASPKEWNRFYLEAEKKYRPYLDYSDTTYLCEGTKWQLQSHIFEIPFYYIEYGLAQIMALSFGSHIENNRKKAFEIFSSFLEQSGMLSLNDLVERNKLFSPFDEKSFQEIEILLNTQL